MLILIYYNHYNQTIFSFFISAELSLDEPCYIHGQCIGARNATVCGAKHNGSTSLTCQCNTGFLRYRKSCLQGMVYVIEI